MTPGRMAWLRAWFDDRIKRGALVHIDGEPAVIRSARDGRLTCTYWRTGERVTVEPWRAVFV